MSWSRSLAPSLPAERHLVPCRRVSQSAVILTGSCVPATLRDFKTGLSPGRSCPEAAVSPLGHPLWCHTQHSLPGVGVSFCSRLGLALR